MLISPLILLLTIDMDSLISLCNWHTTFLLLFSRVEDWIWWSKINGIENDYMKKKFTWSWNFVLNKWQYINITTLWHLNHSQECGGLWSPSIIISINKKIKYKIKQTSSSLASLSWNGLSSYRKFKPTTVRIGNVPLLIPLMASSNQQELQ